MEIRARHMLVGSFVLLFTFCMLVFVFWLARLDITGANAYFQTAVAEPVSGLAVGGDVQFNGIHVGRVSAIQIDRQDPGRVQVVMEIAAETPVRSDSYATIGTQGITGISFIQITGGTPQGEILEYRPAEGPTPIPYRPSQLGRVMESAPRVIEETANLVNRAAAFLDEDNQASVAAILADAAALTSVLAAERQRLAVTMAAMETATLEAAEAAQALSAFARRLDGLVDDVEATLAVTRGTISGFDSTAESFGRAADTMSDLLEENRRSVRDFGQQGLPEITRFVGEARTLVAAMQRLVERIENDPSSILFGDRAPERRLR